MADSPPYPYPGPKLREGPRTCTPARHRGTSVGLNDCLVVMPNSSVGFRRTNLARNAVLFPPARYDGRSQLVQAIG